MEALEDPGKNMERYHTVQSVYSTKQGTSSVFRLP